MTFAFVITMLCSGIGLAVNYASWRMQAGTLQQAVDGAALAVVSDMQVSTPTYDRMLAVALGQARALVPPEMRDRTVGDTAWLTIQPLYRPKGGDALVPAWSGDNAAPTAVRVAISQEKRSLLSGIFGAGSGHIGVEATAETVGTIKICVLALDPSGSSTLRMTDRARIDADGCSIYGLSNSGSALRADGNAQISALKTCVVGGYAGSSWNYRPTPVTGCPPIKDPLAERARPAVGPCNSNDRPTVIRETKKMLQPGTYCGGLIIAAGSEVTLAPGTYIIKDGPLIVGSEEIKSDNLKQRIACVCYLSPTLLSDYMKNICNILRDKYISPGSLTGTDVSFYFTGSIDKEEDGGIYPAQLMPHSSVSLYAPRTGPMAGLLFAEDRDLPGDRKFLVLSDDARRLVGTIYLPSSTFMVKTNQVVADLSEYTAIVANRLDLSSAPRLVINADYGATTVPVPRGIGPNSAIPTLTH
ncbi:TadE/TadG family type IV pilus assembly protein [Methylobacterium sp. JK268]